MPFKLYLICPVKKAFHFGWAFKSQQQPSRTMFVYKIQVNPIHTMLKYDYYDFMDR